MLLRICLVLAILSGIGVIVVGQLKVREHIQGIIDQREANAKESRDWHEKHTKSQKTLAATSNTLAQTHSKLDATAKDLETTRANLEGANSAKDALATDLKKAKAEKELAQADLAKWTALNMTPEVAIKNREDLKKTLDAIAASEEENRVLSRVNQRLTNQINGLVGGKEFEPPMPGLKGKVLVVDPKWNFVVLNVGDKDGALLNGVLLVAHEGKLVGKVKITSVMAERSVANVLPGWKLEDIQELDQVLF